MYALEKPGTRQDGVSAGKGVDFLDNQQLPSEHVDVVGRSEGACCRTACTFDVVASQKSMHCIVMTLLLCKFSSSRMASYHLSHMAFLSF